MMVELTPGIAALLRERQAVLYTMWLAERDGIDTGSFRRAEVLGCHMYEPGRVRFDGAVTVQIPGPSMYDWKVLVKLCSGPGKSVKKPRLPRPRTFHGITLTERWHWGAATTQSIRASISNYFKPYSPLFRRMAGWPPIHEAYAQAVGTPSR